MAALSVPQALQLLQLEPGATRKQIRAAYKRLALQLHPDKQRQQQQQQQQSADATAAFALLSAAYSLLSHGLHKPHSTQQEDEEQSLPAFETAYATGSLFCEEVVNEAVVLGTAPDDIFCLQQLVAAAAVEGQLAQHLAANPPTTADEQLWRQLYTRLQLRQQARQQQQQQQQQQKGGVDIGQLLSDVLLRPSGPLFVEESDSECDSDAEGSSEEGAGAAVYLRQTPPQQQLAACKQQQQQQQQQQQRSPVGDAAGTQQQQCNSTQQTVVTLQQQQQQQQQQRRQEKRLRHGWGFYLTWLRRALLAKALLSLLSSSLRSKMYEHRFPSPLPLPL